MSLIPDVATIQKSLAMLPISTYEPGEVVIAAGATTGKLLLLRQGVVEVLTVCPETPDRPSGWPVHKLN